MEVEAAGAVGDGRAVSDCGHRFTAYRIQGGGAGYPVDGFGHACGMGPESAGRAREAGGYGKEAGPDGVRPSDGRPYMGGDK